MTNDKSGILTMCYEADWHKAIGLAMSLRMVKSELPVAVCCPPSLRSKVENHFDFYIPQRGDLSGFVHKLHLDEYSPFQRTLFIDADILIFRDPQELFDHWEGQPYMARGELLRESTSSFGLRRGDILAKMNKEHFSCIGGAGHAYFEKPACQPIFDRARQILLEYDQWAPGANIADEDIFGIVMTEREIFPDQRNDITAYSKIAAKNSLVVNVENGVCNFINSSGQKIHPLMLHFHTRANPIQYHAELTRLAKLYDVRGVNWRTLGLSEWAHYQLWWGIKSKIRSILNKMT